MSKIYLIRHAESLANTRGIYQGQTYDTDLSDLGRRQAKALAHRLADEKIDRVISSPLKRAIQTAQNLGHMEVDPQLLETDHGRWEGRSKVEIAAVWPDIYHTWLTRPSQTEFPGGEKFTETASRAVAWLRKTARIKGTLVVVTHTNIIQAVIAHLLDLNLDSVLKFPIQPTGITLIESHSPTRIVYINDFSHLNALKSDLSTHAL